jgi:hypothetical protein
LGGEVAKLQQEGPKAGASADDLPVGEINLEKGKPAVVMKRAWLDNSQIADTAEARKRALLQGLATAALRSQVKYGDDERMRREAKGALPVVAMGLAYKDIEMALERIDPENESGGKATKKLSYPSGVGDKQHMGSRSKLGFGLGRKAFYYCFQEGEMLVWDAKGDLDKYIAKKYQKSANVVQPKHRYQLLNATVELEDKKKQKYADKFLASKTFRLVVSVAEREKKGKTNFLFLYPHNTSVNSDEFTSCKQQIEVMKRAESPLPPGLEGQFRHLLQSVVNQEKYQVWYMLKMAYEDRKKEKQILRTFVKKLIFLPTNKGWAKWRLAFQAQNLQLRRNIHDLTVLLVKAHRKRAEQRRLDAPALKVAAIEMVQRSYRRMKHEMIQQNLKNLHEGLPVVKSRVASAKVGQYLTCEFRVNDRLMASLSKAGAPKPTFSLQNRRVERCFVNVTDAGGLLQWVPDSETSGDIVGVHAANKYFVPVEEVGCIVMNVQRPTDIDHCSAQAKTYMKKHQNLQGYAGQVVPAELRRTMVPAQTDTGCWATVCGPRIRSLRGAEPGVVSQDKPVHWLEFVVWVREANLKGATDLTQTYVTVNCLHQMFKSETKTGPKADYMHEFNIKVPIGMDLKDSDIAQARAERFKALVAKIDVWAKSDNGHGDTVIGTAEMTFAELGMGRTTTPQLQLIDPATADSEETIVCGTLGCQASLVGEPRVERMSRQYLSPELLGLAPPSNMSRYTVLESGVAAELLKDLVEISVGVVYLAESTPWRTALDLKTSDYFLEIICGDVMTVTPLLRATNAKMLNFNCTRFVRVTEGVKSLQVQLKSVQQTTPPDSKMYMPFQTYQGAQLIAEMSFPIDTLAIDEFYPGRGSKQLVKFAQPNTPVSVDKLVVDKDAKDVNLAASIYVCPRNSTRIEAALSNDDKDLYLIGDRVILSLEQDFKYPSSKEEYRRRFCTSLVGEQFQSNKAGGPCPLREPADEYELRISGLAQTHVIPLPSYTERPVPFKFVLPSDELEFKRRGFPGVWQRLLETYKPGETVTHLSHIMVHIPVALVALYKNRTADVQFEDKTDFEGCRFPPNVVIPDAGPQIIMKVPLPLLRSPHKNGLSVYDCSIVKEKSGIKIPRNSYGGQLPVDANPSFAEYEWTLCLHFDTQEEMKEWCTSLRNVIRDHAFIKKEQITAAQKASEKESMVPSKEAEKLFSSRFDGRLELCLVKIENLDNQARKQVIMSSGIQWQKGSWFGGNGKQSRFKTLRDMTIANFSESYEKKVASKRYVTLEYATLTQKLQDKVQAVAQTLTPGKRTDMHFTSQVSNFKRQLTAKLQREIAKALVDNPPPPRFEVRTATTGRSVRAGFDRAMVKTFLEQDDSPVSPKIDKKFGEHKLVVELIDTIVREVRFQQCVQTTSMDHPTDPDWSKHPDLAASAGWVFKTKRFLSPVDIPVLILKVWQENPEAGKVFTDSCLGYAQVLTKEIVDPRAPFKVIWRDLKNMDPRELRLKNGEGNVISSNIPEKYDGEMLMLTRFVATNPLHLEVDLPSIVAYRDYGLRMTTQLVDNYGLVIRLGLYDPNNFRLAEKKSALPKTPAILAGPAPEAYVPSRYEFFRDRWEKVQLGTSREFCVRDKMMEEWKLFFYKWLYPPTKAGTTPTDATLGKEQLALATNGGATSTQKFFFAPDYGEEWGVVSQSPARYRPDGTKIPDPPAGEQQYMALRQVWNATNPKMRQNAEDFETYTIFYNNFLLQRSTMQAGQAMKGTDQAIAPRFLLEVWCETKSTQGFAEDHGKLAAGVYDKMKQMSRTKAQQQEIIDRGLQDADIKRTFLGEAWVAQLPAFQVPNRDLTDPSVEQGPADWVWTPQSEGEGNSKVKLKHLIKERNEAVDSTRPDPDKEKGKHVLNDATIDFAGRWVLDPNFKGRFYLKLFGITCGSSSKLPSGEITVEVWEYGQRRTWDCRWRLNEGEANRKKRTGGKVVFSGPEEALPDPKNPTKPLKMSGAVTRVPMKLTEKAKPGKDGIVVDLPTDNPPVRPFFSIFSAILEFPDTNAAAKEEISPLLWEGVPPCLRPYMWMQLTGASDLKRVLNLVVGGLPPMTNGRLNGNKEFYMKITDKENPSPNELWISWEHFYLAKVVRDVKDNHHIGFVQIAEDAVAIEQWAKFSLVTVESEADKQRYDKLQTACKALLVLMSADRATGVVLLEELQAQAVDTLTPKDGLQRYTGMKWKMPDTGAISDTTAGVDGFTANRGGEIGWHRDLADDFVYSKAIMAIAFHLTLQHDGVELPAEDVCLMLLWIVGRYEKGVERKAPDGLPMGPPEMKGLGAYYVSGSREVHKDVIDLRCQLEVLEGELWAHLDALNFVMDELFVPVFEHLFCTFLPTNAVFRLWDVLFDDCIMRMPGSGKEENKHDGPRTILKALAYGIMLACKEPLMGCQTSSACKRIILDYMLSMVGPYDIRDAIAEAQRSLNSSLAGAFDVTDMLAAPGMIRNTAFHANVGEMRVLYPYFQQTREMYDLVAFGEKGGRDVPDNFIVHGDKNDFYQEHGDGVGLTTSALLKYAYPQMRWFALYSSGDRITAKAPVAAKLPGAAGALTGTTQTGSTGAGASPTARPAMDGDRAMMVIRVKAVEKLFISAASTAGMLGTTNTVKSSGPKPKVRLELVDYRNQASGMRPAGGAQQQGAGYGNTGATGTSSAHHGSKGTQSWETEAAPTGVKEYVWMSNNEHSIFLDNEYYTRTPTVLVTLINSRDNSVMGSATIGAEFNIPGSKMGEKGGAVGLGHNGIEHLVNHETGKMRPMNVWLQATKDLKSSAIGSAMTSHQPGGYINLSVEVIVPANRSMNPTLLSAIAQTPPGLKWGSKTWGDMAPFRQQYFERWSPTEGLYKQRLEDAKKNMQMVQANTSIRMRNWIRDAVSGFGDSGDDEMFMRGLSSNVPRQLRDEMYKPDQFVEMDPETGLYIRDKFNRIPPKKGKAPEIAQGAGVAAGISQSQLTSLLVSTAPSWGRSAWSLYKMFYDWNTFQVSLREVVGSMIIMSRGSLAVKAELLFDLFGVADQQFKPVPYSLTDLPLSSRSGGIEYSKGELADSGKIGAPTCISLEGCSAIVQLICARSASYVENRHVHTMTEDIFTPNVERRIMSATLNDQDVLPQITKYMSEQAAAGLGFGLDFSKANMETLGLKSLSSPLGNTLKLVIVEKGQTQEMEVSFGLTGHDTTKKWISDLKDRKLAKDQFMASFLSSNFLCEPLRKFSSTDRIFADLYPMAVKVVIKLTADFEEDEAISELQKLMIEESAAEAQRRDMAAQLYAEEAEKLTDKEKEVKKRERIKNLMKPEEQGGMGFTNRSEAERYLTRFQDKKDVIAREKRDELDVMFKIPQVPYYDKYLQYNADRKLFYGKENMMTRVQHSREANKKNRTEVEEPVFLTDSIWTFKRKVNEACEELANDEKRIKFGSHLYKTVKLGAGYKLEVEHEGKWYELQDNLTFGDYHQYGLTFKNTTKMIFNVRFTMIDSAKVRAESRNRFADGSRLATTYSDSKPLEPGVELCMAPRAVAPWTDPERLSLMRVEAAPGTGVPVDQFAYVKAGKTWVPCMVESIVPKVNGNEATEEVEVILLGPSETVKLKKPLSEVRFVFESNTLLHGEATLLTNEEKALVKEQWSKLRDPKRMVEMLNKRRAEQNRGGKATRVSEKAVHAAIAEAKEAVRETLTK